MAMGTILPPNVLVEQHAITVRLINPLSAALDRVIYIPLQHSHKGESLSLYPIPSTMTILTPHEKM